MKIYEFSGTHRQVGRQHGEELREEFRQSLAERMGNCIRGSAKAGREMSPGEVRELVAEHFPYAREFSPGLMEEVEGIAEGAGARVEEVFLVGGYTDVRDVVARAAAGETGFGCTACWVGPEAAADGAARLAQTWDMYAGAEKGLFGMKMRVEGQPACFAFAYAGCIGMMGMNEQGVALVANKVQPADARPGVPWVFICRVILASASAAEAYSHFGRVRLCSGHHFMIADGSEEEVFSVETTGTRHARIEVAEPTYAHTNHYLDPELKKLETGLDPQSSTWKRLERMEAVLREGRGRIDRDFVENALRDHENSPRSICSHELEMSSGSKVSTCGALVASPGKRELAVVHGYPCRGEFSAIDL